MEQVKKEFFLKSTLEILREIPGMILSTNINGFLTEGEIVEAEAYLGEEDPGSFAFGGKKGKKALPLYWEPGSVYVYLNYGMYELLNIITEMEGKAGAILIRAINPITGIEEMIKRRGINNLKNLSNGPGKLTIALGIKRDHNGLKVFKKNSPIKLFYGKRYKKEELTFTSRIGIKRGVELPYRVVVNSNL